MQTDGFVHVSILNREPGMEGRYQMGFRKVPISDTLGQFVEFAYRTGYRELTDKITSRIDEILTRCIERGPGSENLLARLGFTEEWMNTWASTITLRL